MMYKDKGSDLIVGMSGGKDSLAVALYFKENGYDFKCVFSDTGWEHPETYRYLDYLETKIGHINRVKSSISVSEEHKEIVKEIETELGFESPFIRLIMQKMCMPNSRLRYCTKDLKIEPIREFFDTIDDPINVVGIRHEESRSRSKMEEWEWTDHLDCYTWRPIINWTFEDVVSIHKKHDINPNPLYLKGHNRVGCFPCVYANKNDLKHLSKSRISIIRKIESYVSEYRDKNLTFYKQPIDQMIEWSKTTYGGNQFFLFDTTTPTCRKWGMCGI